ncbi:MAG: hypothetical protein ACI81R_001419 [Bradymonadia bacterium]|jgi:hypothetical protein
MKIRLLSVIGVFAFSACAELQAEAPLFELSSAELRMETQGVKSSDWHTLDAWQFKLDMLTGGVLVAEQFSVADSETIWPETATWPLSPTSRGSLAISGVETDAEGCNSVHQLAIPTGSDPWQTEGLVCLSADYTNVANVVFQDVYVEVSHLSDAGYQAYRWPLGTATNTNDDDHLKTTLLPIEIYQDVWPTMLSTYGITADAWGDPVDLSVIPIDVWEIPIDVWEIPIDVWEIPIDVWEIPIDVWESPASERALWEMNHDHKVTTNSSVLTLRNAQATSTMTIRVLGRL